MSLILILQTTDKSTGNKSQNILANDSKKNQDALSGIGGNNVGRNIENLSFIIKLAKSKKPNLTEDFIKTNFFETDFLILKAKKVFIQL